MTFIKCSISTKMIRSEIKDKFPNHQINAYERDVYVADYTERTKNTETKRSVEVWEECPDIDCFLLRNEVVLKIGSVIYDNQSFVNENGNTQSQCECVVFPYVATEKAWILFLELKYCSKINARKNMNEAKKQLFATYEYYKKSGIIGDKVIVYLIASLPQQNNIPFENFIAAPDELQRWKREQHIVFRGVNEAAIRDNTKLKV